MFIMTLKIIILVLSSMHCGISLYRATVISKITLQQNETEYQTFFIIFLINNSKSVLNHIHGLLPILLMVVVYSLEGFSDPLFVGGALVFALGSFTFTLAISKQSYEKLQAVPSDDLPAIAKARDRINRNSIIHSVILSTGVLLMGLSFILTGT